jgi:hypothetical protein
LCSPADKVAPSGTPATTTVRLSEPSVSTSPAAMLSWIGPLAPAFAVWTARVGAVATGSICTATVLVLVAVAPFAASIVVAATVSNTSPLKCAGATSCTEPR